VVAVRNDDRSKPHSYQVAVTFGVAGPPVQATIAVPDVQPDKTVTADVTAPGTADVTGPTVPCEVTRVVDESGRTPAVGEPIPAPVTTPPPDQPTTPPPTTEPPTTEPPTTEPPTTEPPTQEPPTPPQPTPPPPVTIPPEPTLPPSLTPPS
jgi:hypothetical protein